MSATAATGSPSSASIRPSSASSVRARTWSGRFDAPAFATRSPRDNAYATWQAWGNQYWPAKYLVDARGRVRYSHFGERAYGETEAAIRALLAEAGRKRLGDVTRARTDSADPGVATPETYLGHARAEGFVTPPAPGVRRYAPQRDRLPPSKFALSGVWRVDEESATAVSGAAIHARVLARKVFLVLASRDSQPRRVEILLDGAPVPPPAAGADARDGAVTVRDQRLYGLVSLPELGDATLTVRLPPGVSAYAFTFG